MSTGTCGLRLKIDLVGPTSEGDSRAGEVRDRELAHWEHWGYGATPLSYGSVWGQQSYGQLFDEKDSFRAREVDCLCC